VCRITSPSSSVQMVLDPTGGRVGDDRRSFGTRIFAVAIPQLWVGCQRTPSRTKMRRI
jgi:hypothetical protein